MFGTTLSDAAERRVAAWLNAGIDIASRSMNWPRRARKLAVLALDAGLCMAAVWTAFSLRLGEVGVPGVPMMIFAGAMLAAWYPIAFNRGVYRAIFRFSGRGAMVALTVSVVLLAGIMTALFVPIPQEGVPRTLALLGPILFLMALGLSRIVGRYVLVDLFHARTAGDARRTVLIYGAGASGQRLAADLRIDASMRVAGFLDDDHAKWGRHLDGIRVFRSAQAGDLVARRGITDIVLAMSCIGFARRKQILRYLETLPVNVQTLPPMRDVMDGRIGADALRPIEVEDLLGRPVVPEHGDLLSRQVAGRVVMVTGAGGSIGSEICRQIIAQKPAALVMVEANEFALFQIGCELGAAIGETDRAQRPALHQRLCDVSDKAAVGRLFGEFAPHTIFHAAAYKHIEGRRHRRGARRGPHALPRDGCLGQPRQAQQRGAGVARLSRGRTAQPAREPLLLHALRCTGAAQIPPVLSKAAVGDAGVRLGSDLTRLG